MKIRNAFNSSNLTGGFFQSLAINKLEPGSIITSCVISYRNSFNLISDSKLIENALKNGDSKILPVVPESVVVTLFDISNFALIL